nr:zinc finger, CCHC-type [Tanacetum cinerariifolium]
MHVCKDRCWFKTYESLNYGSILHMGNESTTLVHGRSCVDLRFSSGKIVSLFNVLRVPNIRENLVSSSVLNNYGYKQVNESNKFALSKHGVFIGFGYLGNQMFRLNIVNDNIASAFMSTSKLNDSIQWHARLGHVHFKRIQDMFKDGEIIRLPDLNLKTLGERGIECIFVGYAEHSKTFRFFVIKPNESVSINSIIKSRGAIFYENRLSSVPRPSLRILNETKDIGGLVVLEVVVQQPEPELRKINDEIDSIMGNNTWVLADLPLSCKPLGCKWIFKRKPKVDGTIDKLKARLVIQGFKQKSGIDYFDTYALVERISTIRLLIAMASVYNLIIHQMDVKTTFLNGELDEEVDLTKEFLSSRFFMKDIGDADVILGIKIKHESNGLAISQSYYITKVLKKFNYFDCTLVSTLMDTSEKLMPNNGQAISQLEYSRVIGCIMYVITCRRPYITFVVGKLSRYTSNPGTQHWQAIQRVLKYLKKTMDYSLTYTAYSLVLEGYTDAS